MCRCGGRCGAQRGGGDWGQRFGCSPPSPAGGGSVFRGASHALANPGAQLWVKRYNGRGGDAYAYSVAVSPTGKVVFVTGYSAAASGYFGYATVAYNAATGAQLWVKRYNSGPGGTTGASSLAVSPTGAMVYVTGTSFSSTKNYNYATVAYNATTGAQVWVKRYVDPAKGGDEAYSVAVSPTGKMVFVTGQGYGNSTTGVDYAMVAYNATTGAQTWVKRYNGPANGADYAYSVAVSPTGGTVYVTGPSGGASLSTNYATVAYNATTGAQTWVQRYGGANSPNTATSMAISPTSGTVFVTGQGFGASEGYATIAYHG